MAFRKKIKYFNSFWLKKVTASNQTNEQSNWPGLPWNPTDYPLYPFGGFLGFKDNIDSTGRPYFWYVEETRIKGGYNNISVDLGVRAYAKSDDPNSSVRDSSLIYSGIYNSRTGVNNTNQFPIGTPITRSLDPANGSIQKLYAENTNLIILQENKTSQSLIDKDAVYSAEGTALTTSGQQVIGQSVPYLGEYGISKNPESFAVFGYRKYYTDRYRNKVLRLSRDGITEISNYGMRDFFRDQFVELSDDYQQVQHGPYTFTIESEYETSIDSSNCCDILIGAEIGVYDSVGDFQILTVLLEDGSIVPAIVTYSDCTGDPSFFTQRIFSPTSQTLIDNATELYFVTYQKDKIVGGYDNYNDEYVLSIQDKKPLVSNEQYSTLVYDESVNGWVSFYTYKPDFVDSLRGNYYSFYDGKLWRHHDLNQNRNTFYNTYNDSTITLVFNPNPSVTKNFNTISYEGSNGWEVSTEISDPQEFDLLGTTQQSYNDTVGYDTSLSLPAVKSYEEGKYIDGGVTYRSGFNRKENRYVANIINNSQQRIGEVVFGDQMSGIKGYYATAKLKTDGSTNLAGPKELFSVSSNFVISSY